MTTNAMSCELFNDRLMAYLEHEADDATRAALERHALSCGDCGAVLADVRKLRTDAANLPELTPSRDLWTGIAARIEAPVVAIGTVRQGEQQRSSVVRRWTHGALIAASLIGAAGIGYLAARTRQPAEPRAVVQPLPDASVQVATVPPDVAQPIGSASTPAAENAEPRAVSSRTAAAIVRTASVDRAVATLTADYDREIARLRTLIEQRRNQLDPVTDAIIEKNLQVIDAAIAECKKAIARDPASRFLIESLNQSLQTKVELMRTAALLPSRT